MDTFLSLILDWLGILIIQLRGMFSEVIVSDCDALIRGKFFCCLIKREFH